MNQANRSTKLKKYDVKIVRTIEETAVVTLEARSAEEAEGMAEVLLLHGLTAGYIDVATWVRDPIGVNVKAKVRR